MEGAIAQHTELGKPWSPADLMIWNNKLNPLNT